jgi:flagellar protein FlbD
MKWIGQVNHMILVRRLNGEEIMVNPHLIETIEATPDTVITLISNKRLVVQDSVTDLVARIIEYRKVIGNKNMIDFNELA